MTTKEFEDEWKSGKRYGYILEKGFDKVRALLSPDGDPVRHSGKLELHPGQFGFSVAEWSLENGVVLIDGAVSYTVVAHPAPVAAQAAVGGASKTPNLDAEVNRLLNTPREQLHPGVADRVDDLRRVLASPIQYPPLSTEPSDTQHYKKDAGKSMDLAFIGLVPPRALRAVIRVFVFGAKKYSPGGYLEHALKHPEAASWNRLVAAGMRHFFCWIVGFDKDRETGESHLAHLGCCVLMLLELGLGRHGTDDRAKYSPAILEQLGESLYTGEKDQELP